MFVFRLPSSSLIYILRYFRILQFYVSKEIMLQQKIVIRQHLVVWRMERSELCITVSVFFLKNTMRPTMAGGAPVAPGVPPHPRWIYIYI